MFADNRYERNILRKKESTKMEENTKKINGLLTELISKELIEIADSSTEFIKKQRLIKEKASTDIRYVELKIKEMGLPFSFYYALYSTHTENPAEIIGKESVYYESTHLDHYIVWDKENKRLRYSSFKFIDTQDHEFDDDGNSIRITQKAGLGIKCSCESKVLMETKMDIKLEIGIYLPEFFRLITKKFKNNPGKETIYEKSAMYGKDSPRKILL